VCYCVRACVHIYVLLICGSSMFGGPSTTSARYGTRAARQVCFRARLLRMETQIRYEGQCSIIDYICEMGGVSVRSCCCCCCCCGYVYCWKTHRRFVSVPSQCCAHLLRAIVLASPRIDRHVRASYADSIRCHCPLSPAVMLDDLPSHRWGCPSRVL
jgi:hypothetical protein